MAEDCIMLEHSGHSQKICFHHYSWNENAYTFGYSQSYLHVKQFLSDFSPNLYRRPTGGGTLSHKNDWTYSLAIPSSHKDFRSRPLEVYHKIHNCLATALNQQNIKAMLSTCCFDSHNTHSKGLCFAKAEPFDVIDFMTNKKLAGAAMKRNQLGLLIQGSIDKENLKIDWNNFYTDFIKKLSQSFETILETHTFLDSPNREALYKHFNSKEWNQKQ